MGVGFGGKLRTEKTGAHQMDKGEGEGLNGIQDRTGT